MQNATSMQTTTPRVVKPSLDEIKNRKKGLSDARAWLEYQDKVIAANIIERAIHPFNQSFYFSSAGLSRFDSEFSALYELDDRLGNDMIDAIRGGYAKTISRLCQAGQDINLNLDLICFESLIERVNGGDLIGEAKLQRALQNGKADEYLTAIQSKNREKLKTLLTSGTRQTLVLKRVGEALEKCAYALAPQPLKEFYNDTVMPLTLAREVDYLDGRDLSDILQASQKA